VRDGFGSGKAVRLLAQRSFHLPVFGAVAQQHKPTDMPGAPVE
jgi:hypothetical protein